MKVLVVTNTYPPADISGVGSLAEELLAGLSTAAEIEVLTRVRPPGAAGVVATGGPKLLFPLFAALRSVSLLRRGVDVVHVNESDGVVVALVVALLRLGGTRRPRLSATFQVSYKSEAAQVRPIRAEAEGPIVSTPSRSERLFRTFRAPLLTLAGRLTAHLADRIAACSRFTARELERDYGVPASRVTVIPNGIRIGLAEPETKSPDRSGPLMALYAGRLRTRKAVAVLLEALARPEAAAVNLVVAGDGEQQEALEHQAKSLGLGPRVRFLGRVSRQALESHYQAAHVFALPSTYEGFPVAILEAMAAGLPIVATAVAGVPEAVEDRVSGLLVEPEDSTALAQALGELAQDEDLRQRLGRSARRAVAERFSIERVGESYLELWRGMVDGTEQTAST